MGLDLTEQERWLARSWAVMNSCSNWLDGESLALVLNWLQRLPQRELVYILANQAGWGYAELDYDPCLTFRGTAVCVLDAARAEAVTLAARQEWLDMTGGEHASYRVRVAAMTEFAPIREAFFADVYHPLNTHREATVGAWGMWTRAVDTEEEAGTDEEEEDDDDREADAQPRRWWRDVRADNDDPEEPF